MWEHSSPFLSTHARQIHITTSQLGQLALFIHSLKSKLSWVPTCLSISSPSTCIDCTFLGSKQTVVLPTHNLHTNKMSELVRKGHMFRLDLVKRYQQINWAMNLYDAHQFRFWPFSPDQMALEKGKAKNHKLQHRKQQNFFYGKWCYSQFVLRSKTRKESSIQQYNTIKQKRVNKSSPFTGC